MTTESGSTRNLGSMTLIAYDDERKVYHYRDDGDMSVWLTMPNESYGLLVPFFQVSSAFCHVEPRQPLYLLNPHREKFVPDEDGKSGMIMGKNDGDHVMTRTAAAHLVRTISCGGDKPVSAPVQDHDLDAQGSSF